MTTGLSLSDPRAVAQGRNGHWGEVEEGCLEKVASISKISGGGGTVF